MRYFVLAAVIMAAFAQQKPDFSGTWKQENARSQFAGVPAPISVIDIITHKEPNLHLTQTVIGPEGDSVTSEHDYSTDGREQSGNSQNYTEKTKASWDGATLVIVNTRDYKGRRQSIIRERWVLSDDGKSLRKERLAPGPKGENKQVFVLEKQQ